MISLFGPDTRFQILRARFRFRFVTVGGCSQSQIHDLTLGPQTGKLKSSTLFAFLIQFCLGLFFKAAEVTARGKGWRSVGTRRTSIKSRSQPFPITLFMTPRTRKMPSETVCTPFLSLFMLRVLFLLHERARFAKTQQLA